MTVTISPRSYVADSKAKSGEVIYAYYHRTYKRVLMSGDTEDIESAAKALSHHKNCNEVADISARANIYKNLKRRGEYE